MEQVLRDVPPITLTYMAGAFLTTAACQLELMSPFSLYLNFRMVFTKHQYWRLLTNFLFFGPKFSLDFLFHMFFLYVLHRRIASAHCIGACAGINTPLRTARQMPQPHD